MEGAEEVINRRGKRTHYKKKGELDVQGGRVGGEEAVRRSCHSESWETHSEWLRGKGLSQRLKGQKRDGEKGEGEGNDSEVCVCRCVYCVSECVCVLCRCVCVCTVCVCDSVCARPP